MPKVQASGGGGGKGGSGYALPWEIFPKVPFSGFLSQSDRILADFSLESFICIKMYSFIKNLTDFRKTVETGVDPHLVSSERPLKIQSQGGNLILANGRLINYPKNLLPNFKTILTH